MNNQMFSEGDWVVHAVYGVGQVQGRVTRGIEGKETEYLWIKTNDSDYWLPTDHMDAEYIRHLASETQLEQALTELEKEPHSLDKDHFKRRKEIVEALKMVSLEIKVGLIRDLSDRKKRNGLNISEEDALLNLTNNFLLEWAIVSGEEKSILETKLSQVLRSNPTQKSKRNF